MENNKNAFVDKWSSVYFFIPLFEKPIVMPTAEEFCSKLSEKFGRVTELSEEQKMPEDPAGLKSFVLWDHLVHYSKENQDLPSQLMIYGADEFDSKQFDEYVKAQFWGLPGQGWISGKMPLFHNGKQYAGGRSACHGAIRHSGFLC